MSGSPVRVGAVGVIGLGVMGSALSGQLLAAGYDVYGCDIDADRVAEHCVRGGLAADSPAEIAAHVDVVITSMPTAAALESVIAGPAGLSSADRPGVIVVETSTLALADKHRARELAWRGGAVLLDCPLSGTGQQARAGDVVAYLGGDGTAKAAVMPVVRAFSRAQHDFGEFGNATKVKLVANLLVAIHNAAAAEALILVGQAGLDCGEVLDAVADGAGASRMLSVRGPMMVAGSFTPATMRVSTFLKDISVITEFAAGLDSPTPLFTAAAELYHAAAAQGHADEDTASVFAVLARMAGR